MAQVGFITRKTKVTQRSECSPLTPEGGSEE